jgi:purine-cytosine permease-like protein
MNRKTSRVAFTFVTATAIVTTCIILYSLTASLSAFQTFLLLMGCLIVLWAAIFSFFEIRRISARSVSIGGERSENEVDPDAPRTLIVEPPTGEATPHHENYLGSEGLDQGQLTSRLPDSLPINWLHRERHKKKVS